jgi:hypothetical protein
MLRWERKRHMQAAQWSYSATMFVQVKDSKSAFGVYEQWMLVCWNRSIAVGIGWMVRGSSPGRGKSFFSPPNLLLNGYRDSFPGQSGRDVNLTSHHHLVPNLRMSAAIPLLPLCAFMVWRTLPLLYFVCLCLVYLTDLNRILVKN